MGAGGVLLVPNGFPGVPFGFAPLAGGGFPVEGGIPQPALTPPPDLTAAALLPTAQPPLAQPALVQPFATPQDVAPEGFGVAPLGFPQPIVSAPVEPSPEELSQSIAERRIPPLTARRAFAAGQAEKTARLTEIEEASGAEQLAVRAREAEKAAGLERVAALREQQAAVLKDAETEFRAASQQRVAQLDQDRNRYQRTLTELSDLKIDPERMFRNASTSKKIGLAVGAVASGLLQVQGKQQGNMVLSTIERAIDRDIAAQQAAIKIKGQELAGRGQLFNMGLQATQNEQAALQGAKALALDQVATQVEAAGARSQSIMARQNAEIVANQLKAKAAQTLMAGADDLTKQAQTQEMHELKKQDARLRMRLARGEMALKRRAATPKPAMPGIQLPRGAPLAQARGLYGEGFVKEEQMISNKFIRRSGESPAEHSEGWVYASNKDAKKKSDEALVRGTRVMSSIDELMALYAKEGTAAPGTEVRKLAKAIESRLISAVRVPGEGAVTESDAERFKSQVGGDAVKWFSTTSPDEAINVLKSTAADIGVSTSATLDSADTRGQNMTWEHPLTKYNAALGAGGRLEDVEARAAAVTEERQLPAGRAGEKRGERATREEAFDAATAKERVRELKVGGAFAQQVKTALAQEVGSDEFNRAIESYERIQQDYDAKIALESKNPHLQRTLRAQKKWLDDIGPTYRRLTERPLREVVGDLDIFGGKPVFQPESGFARRLSQGLR